MHQKAIRILLVADTHLGFDLPFKARIQRRRRGNDFFDNFKRALRPAILGEVDLVVHGGDFFYRSRVPEVVVDMAFAPLIEVADRGTPVYLVPGNHERSRIPLHLWSAHPNIHIFTEPTTCQQEIDGIRLALSGFPFTRKIRDTFNGLVQATGYGRIHGDIRILCMHQTVEGAQVGPSNFTFREGPDVIAGSDIPDDFSVVLSGHIHRAQMLTSDLKGRMLGAPVIYPGSVERTSFAEYKEDKQYVIVEVAEDGSSKGLFKTATFRTLPARPMVTIRVDVNEKDAKDIVRYLKEQFSGIDKHSVVRIQPQGQMSDDVRSLISAQQLRSIAPASMNVSVSIPRGEILTPENKMH